MKLAATLIAAVATIAFAAPVDERSVVPITRTIDDSDRFNTYQGAWTHLTNQGSKYGSGTLSYTKEPNAQVVIPTTVKTGSPYTIAIYSSKKSDRGPFNVYFGSELLGTGNEYTSDSETNSEVVFQYNGQADQDDLAVHIKSDKGAQYLAFDYLELTAYF